MKVCIVSDSHDRADALAQAVREAKAAGAEAVIHCGDLIGAQTVKPALVHGLPVHLVVEGAPQALPSSVDLSAYRIVQEALTNTLKHAGKAQAWVTIRYLDEALEIEVLDDGRGGSVAGFGRGGHGLAGMRERIDIFGGELLAGPREEGGFAIRARLPLHKGET